MLCPPSENALMESKGGLQEDVSISSGLKALVMSLFSSRPD